MRYIYLGDRLTDPRFVGEACDPVLDRRGKCVVGRGNALVVFSWGEKVVVLRRRLRLASELQRKASQLLEDAAERAAMLKKL